MTTQQPPQTQTSQPPAIGPLTGKQLHAKLFNRIPGLVVKWSDSAQAYRDAYNALAAELWPPALPPEPVLRAWSINEAVAHHDYWFRLRNSADTSWYGVTAVDPDDCDEILQIDGDWVSFHELLRDYECTIKPGGKIEPCGVLEGGGK